jgi:4-hydroxybenzoyl-CoA reductase subunit alpha
MVNAIADAIGIDVNMLPVTPDRLVEALTQKRRAEKRQAAKAAKAAKAVVS